MRARTRVAVPVLLLVLVGTTACEASCQASTARISEPVVSASRDPVTQEPIEPKTIFPDSTGPLHAAVKLDYAPDDTRIAAVFYYLEGQERQIAADELMAGGSRWVSFELSRPDAGWPAGRYGVHFLLNGETKERIEFIIQPALTEFGRQDASAPAQSSPQASPTPAPPARSAPPQSPRPAAAEAAPPPLPTTAPSPVARPEQPAITWDDEPAAADPPAAAADARWRRLQDDNLGFALEVPAEWGYRLLDSGSYIVEGPQGTDAYEMSVIVQIIDKAANPGSSAAAQLREARDSIAGVADAEIVKEDTLEVAGQPWPFFSARYTARDSRGTERPFAHLQLVIESPAYYFWLSASGPSEIFQGLTDEVDHAIETFTVTR